MKEALFYKKLNELIVQCTLCPNFCTIGDNESGICEVRKNISGTLFTLVYGHPVALNLDPIEKKPLFHFLTGTKTYSLSTNGCNFNCKNCQNFDISKSKLDEHLPYVSPEEIVETAIKLGAKSISYTYTEPTIFYEYMLDIAKLAKEKGLKNIMVTNGFINEEPLKKLLPFIDAVNIDLKGDKNHYENICNGKLEPVLKTIKTMYTKGIFIEITNLIIPGINDSKEDMNFICDFIVSLSEEIPLHFSAFYPMYRMSDLNSTSKEILVKAKNIAIEKGIKHVYLSNI